jgi:hypothetical protein
MAETKHPEMQYAIASIGSGVAWFCLACFLDEAWAIPRDRMSSVATFLLCGVISGLVVSYTFRGAFRRLRLPWLFFLPLITIPVGVSAFAVLLWLARVLLGYHFSPPPAQGDLQLILQTYIIYSLVSLAAVIIYPLSLLNQFIVHELLDRNA